ncbi:ubiquitin-like modifier-activating enzyme ATG7 isoform X5 [Portunus trituberculatus]|uniref:ubiquitin-like modifier-activating enzyme ATG7 isoform X5 n=1 Tax=Portunus trituberculatus TaxID=210409 RepID=UPI001E1D115D|nr:ubiquitin-like modifier-activating enzyme ATG7 isoform X5 [Portunus trituberculatus]
MSAREGVAAGMDHSGREPTILQSVPFSSAVDAGFWHHFTQLKLDVLQLSEQAVPVMGSYTNTDTPGLPPRLYVEYDALERRKTASRWSCHATGTLINTNTIEEFRNRSKQDLLKGSATTLWEAITSGQALQDPSVLASFLMFTFADLKKYHFYYWFAFPAFTYPKAMHKKPPQSFTDALTQKEIESLLASYTSQEVDFNQGFFSITKSDEEFTVHPLRDYPKLRTAADSKSNQEVYLGISDPSTLPSNPGWTLRNLLTLVAIRWSKQWQSYKVVCLRVRTRNGVQDASHSLVVEVDLSEEPESLIPSEMPPCLGWEKNERGKMGPRMVNLSANMDPTRLAESAVDLNLKLMRWRVAPQLNLGVVQQTHCLLLGAGTLGCAVARCLMGWGVRHITLVDSAKVSYSNPVRQNLFTFSDCQSGGRHKAVAAAEALLQIFPKMNSKGVVLSIPMPGHTVGESLLNQVKEDVSTLEQLIDEHDAIFLLMDSRESRWLPTVIGAAKQKSTHDRTLDQQCTVTRPGVSYLAAGHVTELLAAILQHPDKGLAEASVKEQGNVKEGVLGPVPHSLRGFLGRHQLLTPASTSFDQCSGCCREVLKAYMEEGFEFLLKVFNSTAYLEEVSGLSRLHHCVDDSQVWELSDEEDME